MCRIMLAMSDAISRWFPIQTQVENGNQNEFLNLDLSKVAEKRKKVDYFKSFKETIGEIDKTLMTSQTFKLNDKVTF
jgi:hypothetical protein